MQGEHLTNPRASQESGSAPDAEELHLIDAYWRAANYLSVGQIYLLDNPLLREPLTPEHIKPRLLGHWGTTPGLNFIYAHLNRVIRARRSQRDLRRRARPRRSRHRRQRLSRRHLQRDLSARSRATPSGMRRLFRQFSLPGGIPSHVAPETPGSIHEGGELGYSLAHAYGAAFDNPDLLVVLRRRRRRSRDRAARRQLAFEQVPQPGARRRGAADPAPQRLQDRQPDGARADPRRRAARRCCDGYGYDPHFVEGDDPADRCTSDGATLDDGCRGQIREIQSRRASAAHDERPRWPMIVLRTPKGWTGPKIVDGLPVEGTWRAHQVPIADVRDNPEHLAQLEEWMRSYRPEELFDDDGAFVAELARARARRARGAWAPTRTPTAASCSATRAARLPRLRRRGRAPGDGRRAKRRGCSARYLRDVIEAQSRQNFRLVRSRRDRLQPAGGGLRGHRPRLGGADPRDGDDHLSPRRPRDGGAQRAHVPGLARGLSADRPPRPVLLLRGVHPHHRLDVQPARQVAEGHARDPLARADRLAELPAHLARLAPGPQRLLPPGPRLHRPCRQQEGRGRARLSAAGCQLPAVGRRPLPAQRATTST